MSQDDKKATSEGIYALLQQLPILQGASASRLRDVAGRLRLNFRKVAPGQAVVTAGAHASALVCTLSGAMTGGKMRLEGPQMLYPEVMFGLNTRFPKTLLAETEVSVVEIPKEDFRRLLSLDQVFLLNYLNAVCTRAQR